MKRLVVPIVLGFLAITIIAYISLKPSSLQTIITPDNITPSPSPVEQFIKNTPDTSQLKSGGSSYLDPKGAFVFLYPSNYKIDTQNNGQYTRIYMRGATQKGQTEIYDGVLIVLESVDLQGKTLNDFVSTRIEDQTKDGTAQVVSEQKQTLLGDYPGYVYELKGFGDSSHLIIQKDSSSTKALDISYSINDPQSQNYLEEVNKIFTTIELLK